ncbi:SDR family NAD(P)-dependent oxidoreductase [Massilia arenae]|uniref:NADP-dependent 3-hydroxy acid dehydrogenase YdfG n=1 Tax=Massilia arenae TaxID=2603288 RepID=A0A5C7G1Q2_9BURK|nr:SDR family oxidoreductase [Massilia arenae]TXF99783.1 SDR family oxidoreductase [Massilia arenae]
MTTTAQTTAALITGASTGIGARYAQRLAERGYDLVLVARNQQRLEQVAARLRAETGRKVDILAADLTQGADLRRVEERLANDASITLLLNNAGLGATASMLDSSVDDLDRMIALNVTALTRLTRAVVPRLVARGQGTIINISSIAAVAPEVLNGTYGGSKAFVLALTQSLQHEVGAKGIRVQAVLPGATATEFWDHAGVPVAHLPQEIVMPVNDMVDAALAGLDQGEVITIPALPDSADWDSFENARRALGPNLSHTKPAARYAAVLSNAA